MISVGPSLFGSHSARGSVIAECPKCGIRCEDDSIVITISTVYGRQGEVVDETRSMRSTIKTVYTSDGKEEWLKRLCLVCEYSWVDETLENTLAQL